MTRGDYLERFDSAQEAMAYERQALSIDRDLLPDCAIAVLDDPNDEPPLKYWAWLIEQIERQ